MSSTEKDLLNDIEIQIDLATRVKSIYENFKKTNTEDRTEGFLNVKKTQIIEIWEQFDKAHLTLFRSLTREQRNENQYFNNNVHTQTENTKTNMLIKIENSLVKIYEEKTRQEQGNIAQNITQPQRYHREEAQQRNTDIRLPRINIETFSGDYHQWNSFKSLFTSLIHSKAEISNIDKLHHLKSNLAGEALRLISHYSLTDANYSAAWETLGNRYDNERVLVNTELKRLFNQPSIKFESATHLRQLLDTTKECLNSLNNLDVKTDTWNPILIYILTQKIDPETHRHWELSLIKPKEIPSINMFFNYIESRFHALENVQTVLKFTQTKPSSWQSQSKPAFNDPHANKSNPFYRQNNNQHSQYRNNNKTFISESSSISTVRCELCQGQHKIQKCFQYQQASSKKRLEWVNKFNRCINCLGKHHKANCTSNKTCLTCNKYHHSSLHQGNETSKPIQQQSSHFCSTNDSNNSDDEAEDIASTTSKNNVTSLFSGGIQQQAQVLLSTAQIFIFSRNGTKHTFRCLLDQGSQSSFITEEAAQTLQLKKTPISASVTGLGSLKTETSKSLVHFTMHSRLNKAFNLQVQALVLTKITSLLPTTKINNLKLNYTQEIAPYLADPTYHKPGKIDILLGADIGPYIMLDGIKKGKIGEPMAQRTELGWILSGQISPNIPSIKVSSFHLRRNLDSELRKFWEIEEVNQQHTLTEEEQECEQIFRQTHYRNKDGRYTVTLPFKNNRTKLGKSKQRALTRFYQLEKQFSKNESFKTEYQQVIQEYLQLGHMKQVISITQGKSTVYGNQYYLPHHGVHKASSSTTKLRVVFDASAKTSTGESLNEQLLNGPNQQENLSNILLRWRTHRVALSADIAKMYRQIRVSEHHTNFQRILWRFTPDEPITEYQLQTLTFGTTSAAFLATRTLRQLAIDESVKYPNASKIALRDFYVDDLLTGADTIDKATLLQKEIQGLLQSGGFELRKWTSNSPKVLLAIPEELREVKFPLPIEFENTTKTLGIHYHPTQDTFQFKINLRACIKPPTKRTLLSETAKLFDPLGWLAPTIIKAKLLFQQLWKKGLLWDEQLDEDMKSKWIKYRNELPLLEDIVIPRWIGKIGDKQAIQLHGFSDASELAYSAVVYIRIINKDNTISTALLTAKTKVAPINTISLPRLELCGALLLAKLLNQTKGSIKIENLDTYAWTDSSIALAWIKAHPSKWKSFVSNRVAEIQNTAKGTIWRHIISEENPADCASRGITPVELKSHPIWWNGPYWLKDPESTWKLSKVNFDTTKEIISAKIALLNTMITNPKHINILEKYSNLNKLLRIIATCLRFANNCKTNNSKKVGPLTAAEIQQAIQRCVKSTQAIEFHDEINNLAKQQPINPKSRILSLNPFIDSEGILRVGGRLKNATLSFDQKHQMLLPQKHHFTHLLIKDAHTRTEHGGPHIIMSLLRKRFWIIHGLQEIKSITRKCISCLKYRKITTEQIMASLPQERITPARAFTNVGIDYAGPLTLKASFLRSNQSQKCWIALFICLSTKAIHLEVVTDLTTQAYLAAFSRFYNRRGLPTKVFSDNATTFIGANREFSKQFNKILKDYSVIESLAIKGIEWNFIPPRSPHFGGLWEAGIKSMKRSLYKVLGDTKLNYEQLTTVLISIEACLNSRPLTSLTNDHNDLNALSPGHFLIGCEIISPPSDNLTDVPINRINKWKLLQKLQQHFWKRWKNEYLVELQRRNKWKISKRDSKIGDMVLLKEDDSPPTKWPLCRISDVHPGDDDHIRVVTLKTPTGFLKREINKIVPLPIEDNN